MPSWAKDVSVGNRMLNARVESLTDKPAFRKAAATRRCLVPADGWYEWAKRLDSPTKQPYFVTPQDGSVLAFAGLWEVWGRGDDRLYTCTVVTSPAVGRAHRDPRADAAGAARPTAGRRGSTRPARTSRS